MLSNFFLPPASVTFQRTKREIRRIARISSLLSRAKPPRKIRDFVTREFLLAELARIIFMRRRLWRLSKPIYSLWRCQETGLEYCEPPLPAKAAFYDWVGRVPPAITPGSGGNTAKWRAC